MKEKKIFVCENCGEEFINYIDCENHEFKCADKRGKYEENIKNVVGRVKVEFGSLITEITYSIEDYGFVCAYGDFHNSYHFEINIKLSNGNTLSVYDGMDENLWLGNFLEEDVIYESTVREIEKHIPTSFEGVIRCGSDEYGYNENRIGDLMIDDIMDILHGRKVRIEVIE